MARSKFSTWGNDLYTGKVSYNIVGRRKIWYLITAVLLAISAIGLFGPGLKFGLEFRGGSELRVTQIDDMTDYESRAGDIVAADAPDGSPVTVTQVGDSTVRIQTAELTRDQSEAARADLAEEFSVDVAEVSSSTVGPSWGETVTQRAFIALGVFLLLVTVVLSVYFSTWKMAVSALIALIHDVLFTVGIYALLGIEISPASVIGFLTILGYSIYDTIVVFDKLRENTEHAFDTRRQTYGEAANLAVNQTLVRSINTSVVALLPVSAILLIGITLIGPGTLVDLAWALFIGIAVGTYSSIFIATPVLVDLRRGEEAIRRHDAGVLKRRRRGEDRAAQREAAGASPVAHEDEADAADEGAAVPAGVAAEGSASEDGGGASPRPAASERPTRGRQLHPYAQRGPRNQPRRKKRRR